MYNIDDQYQDIALFRITCQFIIEMLNYRGKMLIFCTRRPLCVPLLQVTFNFDQRRLTSVWIKRILEDVNIVSVMIRTKKVITTSLDR